MDNLISVLPVAVQPYVKAIVAFIASVLVVIAATSDAPAWVTIALAVLNVGGVYGLRNVPKEQVAKDSTSPSGYRASVDTIPGVDENDPVVINTLDENEEPGEVEYFDSKSDKHTE